MRYLSLLLLVAPLLAAGCVEARKSENPLSPTIAGPIEGVNISRPETVAPVNNVAISVASQPVTLLIQNAQTNGVRPLRYRFELAADADFNNKLFVREDVTPGEGRTEVRLPDALRAERTYYWRARAEDGANSSDFSGYAFFRIFTPIVIDRPVLQNPVNNVETSSLQPEFAVSNAPRSGPVGPIGYEFEVSESGSFASRLALWTLAEQPGVTRYTSVPLPGGRQFFWRARAFDPTTMGPWSGVQAFRTPAPVVAPTPGTPPANCSAQVDVLTTLTCLRAGYPHPMSSGDRGSLMNATSWAHRADGWGMHLKTGGNRCPQPHTGTSISCDILVHRPTGSVYDVLIDEEVPTFLYRGPINTISNWVAPVQP
jgi:hypothetical protein